MKSILPNRYLIWMAALVGLGVSPAEAQPPRPTTLPPPAATPVAPREPASEQPSEGAALIRQAAASLSQDGAFQAQFRHQVQLLDHFMVGKGVYRQASFNGRRKHRLEVMLRVGEQTSSLQQASDGRFLSIRRNFPGQRKLTRLDLREVRRAGISWTGQGGVNLMHYDGLPGMLEGIVQRFELGAPETTRIGDQEGWMIYGRWKAGELNKLEPTADGRGPLEIKDLPAHIPTHVAVVLSKSSAWPLFPFRIQYRRASERTDGPIQGTTPVVTMEFNNVTRGVQFSDREFELSGENERDVTSAFIQRYAKKPQEPPQSNARR